MRLHSDCVAPALAGFDFLGAPIDLHAYRDRRVLLSFYRYASCPVCNLRVREIIRAYPRLVEQGLEVIAVFQSPPESIAQHVGRQDAPFPIVADPSMTFYKRFGVENSWMGFFSVAVLAAGFKALARGFLPGRVDGRIDRVPADFLIDETGRIAVAHYGKNIDDHLPLVDVERWLHT